MQTQIPAKAAKSATVQTPAKHADPLPLTAPPAGGTLPAMTAFGQYRYIGHPLQRRQAQTGQEGQGGSEASGNPAPANRTGLPDQLKSGIESLSGLSMDKVKVHYNSAKPARLNALAYAQGSDIHLAHGQEQHLPHEAWHVVQQAQGRVKPTMQMKQGVGLNDDQGLEHEADVMGGKAVQMVVEPNRGPSPAMPMALIQGAGQKNDGVFQFNKKKKRKQKKVEKGIAYREKMEQREINKLIGKSNSGLISPDYELSTVPLAQVVNPPREFYDVVTRKVKEILDGYHYRVGGSSAAKEYGASRNPQDLDLEFWNYDDAVAAGEELAAYQHEENDNELYGLYFVCEAEPDISVTVTSMVTEKKGDRRMPGPTIELNNENTLMSEEDYRVLPIGRMRAPKESGGLVRRGSLIAGSLLRYSSTLIHGEEDTKQDITLIRSLLRQGDDDGISMGDVFAKIDLKRLQKEDKGVYEILMRVANMESLRAGEMSAEIYSELLKAKGHRFMDMIGTRERPETDDDSFDSISDEE